jgi:hypothetical protein
MHDNPYVTRKEMEEGFRQIGMTVGKAHKEMVGEVNKITKAFNELYEQLGNAQNVTASVVDEDRDLLNTVILHQKYIMEKLGALTPEGEWTEEFQQWCSTKIEEAKAIQASANHPVN